MLYGAGALEKLGGMRPLPVSAGRGRAARFEPRDVGTCPAPDAGPGRPGRLLVTDDLQFELGRGALSVGEVVPGLGLVKAGLEVGGVRAAADVDDRRRGFALDLLDLTPGRDLGPPMLSVDRDVGNLAALAHPELDHLPVALVEAKPSRQVVVVVEVEEPVLEPNAAAVLLQPAVHPVRVSAILPQG